MDLLQMSLSGAILILIIIVLRAVLLYKLPKSIFLVLWGIVLIRLLIPFSVPASFSFYTFLQKGNAMPEEASTFTEWQGMNNNITEEVKNGEEVSIFSHEKTTTNDQRETINMAMPGKIVWAVGMSLVFLFFLLSYLACYMEFQFSLPVEEAFVGEWLKRHSSKRGIQIRMLNKISAPLTYGIFHPVILIPKQTDWSNEKEVSLMLEHEYVHIRRFDLFTKLLLITAVCVHWFNPMVWIMYFLVNRDIEISCDECVLKHLQHDERREYACMLICMEEKRNRFVPLGSSFSKNAIEERIVAIMKFKKISKSAIVVTSIISVMAIGTFTTSASNVSSLKGQAAKEEISTVSGDTENNSVPVGICHYGEKGNGYFSFYDEEKYYRVTDARLKEIWPDEETEWWTFSEYKKWMEQEYIKSKGMLGEVIGSTPTKGTIVMTEEELNAQQELYGEILSGLENGYMTSKSFSSNPNLGVGFDIRDLADGAAQARELEMLVTLTDGTERKFGPYAAVDQLLDEVEPFCVKAVSEGKLSEEDADEILGYYISDDL